MYNVQEVKILDTYFNETSDHSKWAVATESSLPITCIGDINRQVYMNKIFASLELMVSFKDLYFL